MTIRYDENNKVARRDSGLQNPCYDEIVAALDAANAENAALREATIPRCPKCGYTEADCRFYGDHRLCGMPEPPAPPHKRVAELTSDLAAAKRDAERIDLLERCIRDGSYASIFNDIIAACHHAYATIGPGPALRTCIDAAIAAPGERMG